ncbi:MAG: MBL fold metallo-hydrolase [Sphingomicrobium sp.]
MAVTKLALTFTLVVSFGATLASAQTPHAVSPEARNFMMGKIKVTALHDGGLSIPNDAKTFGVDVGASAVASVLRANGQPTDAIPVSINSLLVRVPGHVVLIDTGLGTKANSELTASLAAANIAPSDITDVLITHTHGDHVGGLIDSVGGVAFPNAKVRMAAAEWAYMKAQSNAAALVAAIRTRVATFASGAIVIPGITSVDIPGHTPGHVGYEIMSGSHRLLDIGDTAHSSLISLAEPDWTMGFDSNKVVGKMSRRRMLTRLSKSHELIFAPHFPFPGVGTVAAKGTGFVWVTAGPSTFVN